MERGEGGMSCQGELNRRDSPRRRSIVQGEKRIFRAYQGGSKLKDIIYAGKRRGSGVWVKGSVAFNTSRKIQHPQDQRGKRPISHGSGRET